MFWKKIDISHLNFDNIISEITQHYANLVTINTFGIGFKNKQKALMRPYIEKNCPHIYNLYQNPNLINKLNQITGQNLQPCDSSMVRSSKRFFCLSRKTRRHAKEEI